MRFLRSNSSRSPFHTLGRTLGLLITLLCALGLTAGVAQADDDMTLEQVLEKHAEARGGEEAFSSIDTARVKAKMVMGQGMEAPMTLYVKEPGKMRMDMVFQGATIVQAWDGEKGWQIMPLMGNPDPQELTEEETRQFKRQDLVRGLLLTYQDHGYEAEYLGVEEVEGTPAHKIKVSLEDDDVAYSYLDTDYFMEFLREMEGVNAQTGQRGTTMVTLGDYKEVAGVMMPYSMEVKPKGAPAGMTMTIESIEVNTGDVSDDLFVMPEVEAATEEPESESESEG